MSIWTVKPVVLPDLPMNMKRAPKANQVKLEKAWILYFICWIQNSRRIAFVDRVNQFVSTYSMKTEKTRVDRREVNFSVQSIGQQVKLPTSGTTEGQLSIVKKKQHDTISEGEYPKVTRQWKIDKARQQWRLWLQFVNDYLIFRPQVETMAEKFVIAAIQTWEGKLINWSHLVQRSMHREIWRAGIDTLGVVELYSASYISILCKELPKAVIRCDQPTTSHGSNPLHSPCDFESLLEDKRRLKLQVQKYQTLLHSKSRATTD